MPKKSKKEPRNYLPLFVDDLENEESLKLVSDSAWKLWIRIIAYTWCKSPKPGYLLTKAGAVPSLAELSLIFSVPETLLISSLAQLEKERVFDRGANSVIICRRQVEEARLSRIRSKAGAKGGAKSCSNFAQAKVEANTQATPGGGGGYISSDPDPEKIIIHATNSPKQPTPPTVTPERGLEIWREVCVPAGCSDIREFTSDRKEKFRDRMKKRDAGKPRDEVWLRAYLQRIANSDFCRGGGPTSWVADFDFAFRSEKVVLKVLEGKYDNRDKPKFKPQQPKGPPVIDLGRRPRPEGVEQ